MQHGLHNMTLRLYTAGTATSNLIVYGNETTNEFNTLKIGGGGWVTGIDIADDGGMVVRTDTYGGYIWRTDEWVQLVTTDSMPVGDAGNAANGDLIHGPQGIYEIAVAPSNSSIIYMFLFNKPAGLAYIYKSTNGGVTFTRTAKSGITVTDGGGNIVTYTWRMNGPYMDVHPTDPNIVVIGTPTQGAFYTTDGGSNWNSISGILNPTTTGPGMLIQFDPSNGENVYISSSGRGVYRSTDGADGTFSLTSSGPTTHRRMCVGSDGVLMLTNVSDSSNLWRFQSGSWTALTYATTDTGTGSAAYWHSVCPDPDNSGHWYMGGDTGNVLGYTANNGGSFTGLPNRGTRVATDVPWLAVTSEQFMSNGDMRMFNGDTYFSQGIGVFVATLPTTNTTFDWVSQTVGIEQMVTNQIISPPGLGRNVIVSFWDRAVFQAADPEVYPSAHGFDNNNDGLAACWSIDYASDAPDTTVGYTTLFVSQFGVSSDNGETWSVVTSPSSLEAGGCVAASTATNFVQVSGGDASRLRYSTNGGSSWGNSTVTTVPTSGETGWGADIFAPRHILCADRAAANTFYAYNNGTSGDSSFAGIWSSTNSGANFTKIYAGRIPSHPTDSGLDYSYNAHAAQLTSVPGIEGRMHFTCGNVDSSNNPRFFVITVAGGVATPTVVPNVTEVKAFGYGKEFSGASHPALYIIGYVNNVYGVYRSNDADQATPTWTSLGTFPLGRSDEITAVCGDMNTYGRLYIGYRGSSCIYGDFS